MPQYQGVWTLPVAARLQSNQQWVTDPLYRNTTLLLQADNAANGAQNNTFLDSSSNNFTITRNGNATQGTFTPFSQSPGWWGNYFDGTGDYLSAAANAAFQFGTGNFTIEFWYYPTSFGTNTPIDMGYANTGSYVIQSASDGKPYFYSGTTGIVFTATTGYTLNAWNHLVVSRSGTTLSMFINGVRVGTATNSTNFNANFALGIGGSPTHSTAYEVVGYMSNVRLIKGTAIYDPTQSTITVPTSPLTAITNTSLLTCQSNRFVDNSTNAFAITVNGNTSVQAFSPFAPQYQYTPSITGGSGYFDGTTSYLTVPNNSSLSLGSESSWTVEFWAYFVASPNDYDVIVGKGPTAYEWFIEGFSDNTIDFLYTTNGSPWAGQHQITPNMGTGSWFHVAAVRNGSTFKSYVNGVEYFSTTAFNIYTSNADLNIGGFSGGQSTNMYLSSLRIVKGTAVYTSNFTPPTTPLTNITNTSLLLNFTNAGIYDGTLKNNLETAGNAQVSTSVVKYGTGSMYFDGTGDYLKIQPSDLLATWFNSDYTIEYWVYPNAFASSANGGSNVYSQSDPASTSEYFSFGPRASGVVVWYYYNGAAQVVTSGTISTGVWTHLAWTYQKSSNTMRIFINGVLNTTTTIAGTPSITTTANPILVGASTTVGFNGYLDDLRITKGIARYTANFTPPTVALPRQ